MSKTFIVFATVGLRMVLNVQYKVRPSTRVSYMSTLQAVEEVATLGLRIASRH